MVNCELVLTSPRIAPIPETNTLLVLQYTPGKVWELDYTQQCVWL